MILIYHAKMADGWREIYRAPITSSHWNKQDRWAIDHLLEHGEQVLTMGEDMWELQNPPKITRPTPFEQILNREIEERRKST